MKNFNRNITLLGLLLALVVGMVIGKALLYNSHMSDEYNEGFKAGYSYAVHSARLTENNGYTYVIVYGDNDGNEYER